MTATDNPAANQPMAGSKPRLVLMGEFSSGKSTLSNILLGETPLPMQVTATRLPPVHISYGPQSAHAIMRDGTRREVDLGDLASVTPQDTASVHLTLQCETLELCDLVDMPGISDPNMPSDTWDAVVRPTDHVIWCTHATQAWRQSEAALWDRLRDQTSGQNLLLITQFDKLRNERDRGRVLNRVVSEVEGKFSAIYPVSLLEALRAGDDFEAWKASGAHDFMEHLIEILVQARAPSVPQAVPADVAPVAALVAPEALSVVVALPARHVHESAQGLARPDFQLATLSPRSEPVGQDVADVSLAGGPRVMPKRVRVRTSQRRPTRLPRSAADVALWPVEPGAR